MTLLLLALLVLGGSGVVALVLPSERAARTVGAAGAVAGSVLGIVPALLVLAGGPGESLSLPWQVPYGSFSLGIDPLSALFLLPVFGLTALCAVYGHGYLEGEGSRRRAGAHWLFLNLLAAGMAVVVTARNGVLFLVAWEAMSLASYFLVVHHDDRADVRRAGWTYLVAAHLGNAFLLALFVLLGAQAGSLDFGLLGPAAAPAGVLFLLAVVGFGTKAGFVPFHVWLPEAHPAAPSHVSALMSGVMIKTGIYGILRVLTFIGPAQPWWGWLLVAIGLLSGLLGIAVALAQRQMKRLLAYSSVENMGIVALGLGVGVIGLAGGHAGLAVFGFAGGLLHLLNHSLIKSLLFLGAGSVMHGAGTGEMDRLGGLGRRMPWTGAAFLAGSVAIAGLPPMNGFTGELLIYLAAFRGQTGTPVSLALPLLGVIVGLATIGGLAAACFLKAYGTVFLGEGRTEGARTAHEAPGRMRVPPAVLAAACAAMGLGAPLAMGPIGRAVLTVTGLPAGAVRETIAGASQALLTVAIVGAALAAGSVLLLVARRRLLAARGAEAGPTWDCGYAAPTPRMQYTSSSFVQPLTSLFGPAVGGRTVVEPARGLFPAAASLRTETGDPWTSRLWRPVFAGLGGLLSRLRWLQHGNLHLYVLYIAATLLALLVWQAGWAR